MESLLRRALEHPPPTSGTGTSSGSASEPLSTAPLSQLASSATVPESHVFTIKQEVVHVQEEEFTPRTLKQPRGRHLHPSALKIVHNATEYFASKKKKYRLDYNVRDVAAECTGVSVATIARVRSMTKKTGGIISEGMFKMKTVRSKREKFVSGFTDCDIRKRVYELYLAGELPTHKRILESAKADGMLDCSREVLRMRLQKMGFESMRFHNLSLTMEKPEITASRLRYIRQIRQFRRDGRNIVFLLETKSCTGQAFVNRWYSTDKNSWVKGKVASLVCTCAGLESGLMKGTLSVCEQIRNAGCEKVMTHDEFFLWLEQTVLRRLPPDSVIVIETADHNAVTSCPYPTMTSPKPSVINWLQQYSPELKYSELKDLTRAELLEMVGNVKVEPTSFVVDRAILERGHTPVRIPPFHYDLNPMRYFWVEVQESLAKLQVPRSTNAMKNSVHVAFEGYATAKWQTAWKKVEKYEKIYWNADNAIDNAIDELTAKYSAGSTMSVDDEGEESEGMSEDDSSVYDSSLVF